MSERGLNKGVVIGRVGKVEPARFTPSGKKVVNFSLAANSGREGDPATWFECAAFEKLAEIAEQYVQKGMRVYVEGPVSARAWLNDQGEARCGLRLMVNQMLFLGDGAGGEDGTERPTRRASRNGNGSNGNGEHAPAEESDEIPF